MRPLRVLTLNCWNVSAPFEARTAVARAGLAALAPDVVAFQEVIVRRDGFDQAALWLDGLGHRHVFGAAWRWNEVDGMWLPHDAPGDGFGHAIASRWPIVASAVVALPHADVDERCTALAVLVEMPGGRLPVVTTHLDWRYDHGWIRERQVLALADVVDAWRAEGTLPPIVCGDLNADPESAEVRFLRGLASLDGRSTYLQDAWALAGDGGPGITWDHANPYVAATWEPSRRIDYVLVGQPDADGRGWIERARIVLDAPVDGVRASDHYGVVADVAMRPDA